MTGLDRLKRQLVRAVTDAKPHVPDAGRLLWRAFIALHNARGVTMAGAQAITHEAMQAYARSERLPLRASHVRILQTMDDAWLTKARAKEVEADPGAPRVSTQEISPALFDAVFG